MTASPAMRPAEPVVSDFSPHQVSALRPSEYTAALIQAFRVRADWVRGANVLEIGSGSGVVLAALAELGAASLWMERFGYNGRLPSWSSGGPDGRRLLDRFLRGLAEHLAPNGRAIITHNGFVDLELSRAMVARDGLSLQTATTLLVYIPSEKLGLMTESILSAEEGRSIHHYGPYLFAEMHIVEIGSPAALG
jgi:release factor glutamine methyltransferase